MRTCASCRRLHRPTEATCPFCRVAPGKAIGTATLAVAIAAAVATTACYGGPSKHDRAYVEPPPEPSASAAPQGSR